MTVHTVFKPSVLRVPHVHVQFTNQTKIGIHQTQGDSCNPRPSPPYYSLIALVNSARSIWLFLKSKFSYTSFYVVDVCYACAHAQLFGRFGPHRGARLFAHRAGHFASASTDHRHHRVSVRSGRYHFPVRVAGGETE